MTEHSEMIDHHEAESSVDGRRLRRQLNRRAVVEALVRLHSGGHLEPTIDEIAEEAGLSARSVFRYFADLDDLVSEAVSHQQQRLAPLVALDFDLEAPLDQRLPAFVAHRRRLVEAMGNVAVVARQRAHNQPLIAAEVRRMRTVMRNQVARTFAPELGAFDPDTAARRLAALDVLCSFEAQQLWRDDQNLAPSDIAQVMVEAMGALLTVSRVEP